MGDGVVTTAAPLLAAMVRNVRLVFRGEQLPGVTRCVALRSEPSCCPTSFLAVNAITVGAGSPANTGEARAIHSLPAAPATSQF